MNTFTLRALFSVLIVVSGLGLAGCPNLGMHTRIQSITEQDQLVLKESPANFSDRSIRVAAALGYPMQSKDAGQNLVVFKKTLEAAEILKAVAYGAQDSTMVKLQLGGNTIIIIVEQTGNFGETNASLARETVEKFTAALKKEFGPTATAKN